MRTLLLLALACAFIASCCPADDERPKDAPPAHIRTGVEATIPISRREQMERIMNPVYDEAWGRSGVFVFGDSVIDLRNGQARIGMPDGGSVSDCSTEEYWCLYGDVTFALPKRCRRFSVGDTFTVRGIAMTVKARVDVDPTTLPDFRPPPKEDVRIYFFQAEADKWGGRTRQFLSYSRRSGVIKFTDSSFTTRWDWNDAFDPARQDFTEIYAVGPLNSFDSLAPCDPGGGE